MSELTERNLIENLKQYLIDHGYPAQSIISEYKLGQYRADLVIIDTETNTPIQLFELKSSQNKNLINMGKQQLAKFLHEARKLNADVIGYLVVPSQNSPFFKIINSETEDIRKDNIDLNYKDQVNRSRSSRTEILKTKKAETVDEFKKKIRILLYGLLIIFLLDALEILKINNIRFYLIIMIAILYILPYYEEIKIFNLELKKTHNNSSTD